MSVSCRKGQHGSGRWMDFIMYCWPVVSYLANWLRRLQKKSQIRDLPILPATPVTRVLGCDWTG